MSLGALQYRNAGITSKMLR